MAPLDDYEGAAVAARGGAHAIRMPEDQTLRCCGVNNRGVALWKDKVISIALDGRSCSPQPPSRRSCFVSRIVAPVPPKRICAQGDPASGVRSAMRRESTARQGWRPPMATA